MVQELVELEGPDPPHTQAEKMKRVRARHGWKSRSGIYREAFDALSFNAKSDKSICDLLYVSAALDRADIVNALLRSGADPNIMMERVHHDYPLLAALRLESMAAADALLNSNAKVNVVARELGEPVFYTPLGCALQMMNLDLVRRLLNAGAKANSPTGSSPTLLSFCIFTCPRPSGSSSGKLVERIEEWIFDDRKRQIMDVLIRAGAELNFIFDGISLYSFALLARSVAFAKYLTDNDADFNISDSDGDRPLHMCIWSWVKEEGDAEARDAIESILKHLLDVGASWRALNDAGTSARELVLSIGDKASEIAALFPVSSNSDHYST
jgi:ankyrin repeat protein